MSDVQLYLGDCLDVLRTLDKNSVQCVVTSPPYWGLRDYGTARWEGGNAECDHKPGNTSRVGRTTLGGGTATTGHQHEGYCNVCGKCGAIRIDAQLGLEATPEEYVANLVAVFREVRRVLRPDGCVFLNLGDSYTGSGKGHTKSGTSEGYKQATNPGSTTGVPAISIGGLKPKDLVGIPWRVAFALQADGWWLRSDIIWAKPNPMPESVKDRPTRSYEHVFLLAKSDQYYYDAAAIAEPAQPFHVCGRSSRANVDRTIEHGTRKQDAIAKGTYTGFNDRYKNNPVTTRNKRDVWTISTKPFRGAHFATMPPDLVEPCILAGSKPGDVVLDPFAGAGTVALVAARLNRRSVSVELNLDYIALAWERLSVVQPELAYI